MTTKCEKALKILQLMREKIDELEETLIGQGRPLGVSRLYNQTGEASPPLSDRRGQLEDDLEWEAEKDGTGKIVFSFKNKGKKDSRSSGSVKGKSRKSVQGLA